MLPSSDILDITRTRATVCTLPHKHQHHNDQQNCSQCHFILPFSDSLDTTRTRAIVCTPPHTQPGYSCRRQGRSPAHKNRSGGARLPLLGAGTHCRPVWPWASAVLCTPPYRLRLAVWL